MKIFQIFIQKEVIKLAYLGSEQDQKEAKLIFNNIMTKVAAALYNVNTEKTKIFDTNVKDHGFSVAGSSNFGRGYQRFLTDAIGFSYIITCSSEDYAKKAVKLFDIFLEIFYPENAIYVSEK